jgi:hypothetical protein
VSNAQCVSFSVWVSSLPALQPETSGPGPKLKGGMKKSILEIDCEFEASVKSPLWLLKEKVVGGC